MTTWLRLAKKVGTLLMIELFLPGGTLVVLGLLAAGGGASGLRARLCRLRPGRALCRAV